MAAGGAMALGLLVVFNAVLLGALVVVLVRSKAPEKVFAAIILLWLPAPVGSFILGVAVGAIGNP